MSVRETTRPDISRAEFDTALHACGIDRHVCVHGVFYTGGGTKKWTNIRDEGPLSAQLAAVLAEIEDNVAHERKFR